MFAGIYTNAYRVKVKGHFLHEDILRVQKSCWQTIKIPRVFQKRLMNSVKIFEADFGRKAAGSKPFHIFRRTLATERDLPSCFLTRFQPTSQRSLSQSDRDNPECASRHRDPSLLAFLSASLSPMSLATSSWRP
jgi:hypothetical protein